MLVRESISFERGADPKKILGIGDYERIRNLKILDILILYDETYAPNNRRYVVIVDINYNNREDLYLEYAGFGENLYYAINAAKHIHVKYMTNSDTKTLKEWDKIIIDIIKN